MDMKYSERIMNRAADAPTKTRHDCTLIAREADVEIDRLRGEREVLVQWIRNALLCLETIDPDDQEDGGEYHRMFMDSGERLVTPVVHRATLGELF
jgi:hypothetical protein